MVTVLILFCAKVLSRPPVWLRKVCRSYLQQIVSKPDGVLNVLISTVHGMAYLLCNLCWCKWTERADGRDYIVIIVVSIAILLSSQF